MSKFNYFRQKIRMDSLTQIVLGAAVGEATLGKKAGNNALLYGAIAGTIPDLDVIFGKLTDTITAIEWHRGFSHSILFCVLMAPFLGWIINKLERKLNLGWRAWTKLFFWGLFTHPLLDAFTTWGTQLFWPFDLRIAFNSIFVIDPIYTLPFFICTMLVLFQKRDSSRRRKINRIGLFVSTFYLVSTLLVKQVALQQFKEALTSQGITYMEISSRPAPFNTIVWNANIDTEDYYLLADYSFFDRQKISFKKYPKNREASKAIEKDINVQRLIKISNNWYILDRINGDWYFNDLRFGIIPNRDGTEKFTFSYLLKKKDNTFIAIEVPKTGRDASFLMEGIWNRIKGN